MMITVSQRSISSQLYEYKRKPTSFGTRYFPTTIKRLPFKVILISTKIVIAISVILPATSSEFGVNHLYTPFFKAYFESFWVWKYGLNAPQLCNEAVANALPRMVKHFCKKTLHRS